MPRTLSPTRKFVVHVYTLQRKDVASDLNDFLHYFGWGKKREFAQNDHRLTERVMNFLVKREKQSLKLQCAPELTADATNGFDFQTKIEALEMMGISLNTEA